MVTIAGNTSIPPARNLGVEHKKKNYFCSSTSIYRCRHESCVICFVLLYVSFVLSQLNSEQNFFEHEVSILSTTSTNSSGRRSYAQSITFSTEVFTNAANLGRGCLKELKLKLPFFNLCSWAFRWTACSVSSRNKT